MKKSFKDRWRRFRHDDPGSRFLHRFERRQEKHKHPATKMLYIGGGIVIIIAGVLLIPIPGPSFIMFLFGAGLIAQESRHAARFLDKVEFWIRKIWRWGRKTWHVASMPLRLLVVSLALVVLGGAGFGVYHLLFR